MKQKRTHSYLERLKDIRRRRKACRN